MEAVSSRRNPLVALFRELARTRPADDSRVLLEGVLLVEEAQAAGLAIEVAMVSGRRLDSGDPAYVRLAETLGAAGVRVVRATEPVIDAASPVRTAAGVVAAALRRSYALDDVCRPEPALVGVVVDVQDPGNVGAVARAAHAAGATGLVVAGASADPFGWKALRGAMGSAFRLPVVRQADATAAAHALRERGIRLVATVPRGGRPLFEAELAGGCAVLLGSEGAGLAPELARLADETISIPMRPPVESLNVAVTAALVLYEAFRRRRSG